MGIRVSRDCSLTCMNGRECGCLVSSRKSTQYHSHGESWRARSARRSVARYKRGRGDWKPDPRRPGKAALCAATSTAANFIPATKRAGFEGLRFHELRHTCAALLIANGAHPKEIADRLGQCTVRLSLDRYGHPFPSLDERLKEGLERAYREAPAASPRPGGSIVAALKSRRGRIGP